MFSVWALTHEVILSITSEELAATLAEKHPNTIYFFAELV
jgi:hypothetical protein